LKRHRTLRTEEEVARARRRAQEDPEAKQVLDGILAKADEWARRDDAWLEQVITRKPHAEAPTLGEGGSVALFDLDL
jgi:hypothetical protein